MTFWIVNLCLAFFLCVFFTGIVIPQILLIAFRKQLFDEPDERKIHRCVVPRLGGIAFKPVVFFSIALLIGLNIVFGHHELLTEIEDDAQSLSFGFCSIMVLYLVGMADDLIGVRYRAKFIVQILCGLMLIAGGIWVSNLHGVLGLHTIPQWLGYPLTILIVVFIINAINLIDGIDGLASGLCSIAFLFYGQIFYMQHQYLYSMLSFATLGVLVSFFYYNVFGNPTKQKKIFMGDTGSLTIGMMICFLSLRLLACPTDEGFGTFNPIMLAFAPLFIPGSDVVRVYLHRVRNGRNPFLPDKNHIHHKLLAVGLCQHRVMITVVLVSLLFSFCNIILSRYININGLVIADIIVWVVTNIWLSNRIKRYNTTSGEVYMEAKNPIKE